MGIKIRKATEEDAPLLAWAIMTGSRDGKASGLFDVIFQCADDAELLDVLARLVTTATKSYCHYSNFIVAEDGGKVAGVLCGYEPRIAPREIFTKALAEVGVDESYEERIAAHLLCVPAIDRQTWVLDFIAEPSGSHSFEVIREMVQKSLLTARLKGYRKVQTMVEIGSRPNQLLFEKLGFSFEDEKRSDYYKELFGRAGIMRYSLTL